MGVPGVRGADAPPRLGGAALILTNPPFGTKKGGGTASLKRRRDTGEAGRFRRFTREEIAARGDSLDIAWLKDDSDGHGEDLPEPADLAREALGELDGAAVKLRALLEELGEAMHDR